MDGGGRVQAENNLQRIKVVMKLKAQERKWGIKWKEKGIFFYSSLVGTSFTLVEQ